jgi:hypothetical protein
MDHFREKRRDEYLLALLELHNGNYGSVVSNREACHSRGRESTPIFHSFQREAGAAYDLCHYRRRNVDQFISGTSLGRSDVILSTDARVSFVN